MNVTLSSKQVAEILGVNESSVKRWADSGMLTCHKTPGGHRKFMKKDILFFGTKYSYDVNTALLKISDETKSRNNEDIESIINIFYKKLFVSSEDELLDYLHSLILSGLIITDIYDSVISKTMRKIGEQWINNELSIEQEHIATNKIMKVLIRLHAKITPKSNNGLTALCCSLENEYHELPVLSVSNVLSYYGWKVIYAGSNMPVKSIQSSINEFKPDVVCISVTIIKDKNKFFNDIKKINSTSQQNKSRLILGGSAIISISDTILKTDAIVSNTSELVKYVKNNFRF